MPVCLFVLVAQTAPAADTYAAGLACYEQLDFHCAIELLSAAAREESGGDPARLLDIYRKLADSHLALGRREEAIADFVQLLRRNPDYQIDKSGTSPKILDAFGEARDQLKREEQARLIKKAPPPPPPPSRPGEATPIRSPSPSRTLDGGGPQRRGGAPGRR